MLNLAQDTSIIGKVKEGQGVRVAVVDLGSNSVRFEIYEVDSRLKAKRIYRLKEMIRLGDGVFQTGRIQSEAFSKTIQAFTHFQEIMLQYRVATVEAVATSTLRDSLNSKKLLSEIRSKSGIEVRVISGLEEAELIAQGILKNEAVPEELFIIVDIGGGSTEVCLCHKNKLLEKASFNLGSNRLHQVFLKASPPTPSFEYKNPIRSLCSEVKEQIEGFRKMEGWPKVETIVGSSGTIKAFSVLLKSNGFKVDPFRKKSFSQFLVSLETLTPEELLKVPGMDPKRSDMILAGGLLLDALMEVFGSKRVFTSSYALRHGMVERVLEHLAFQF